MILAGCVTQSPLSSTQGKGVLFGQDERDQTFLSAQLYIFAGNMPEAEKVLKVGIEKSSDQNSVKFKLMLSRVQAELGKIEEAYKRYVELANDHPSSEAILKETAQFLYGIRLKEDAYGVYSRLVRINPKESNYWIYRGLLALELANVKEAWDSFDFLIRKSSDAKHLGHLYMGKLMQMTGFKQKAGGEFKKCLAVKPETRECVLELARKDYGSGYKARARRSVKKYLRKYKFRGNQELADQLIDWHVKNEDLKSAILEIENLERVSPADINIKRRAAMLMAQYKNYDAAMERMEIVVRHDKSSELDSINYVNILQVRGEEEKAVRYLASAISSPKSTEKTFFKKYEVDKSRLGQSTAVQNFKSTCKKSINKEDCTYVHSYLLWESGDVVKSQKILERALRRGEDKSQKLKYFLSQIYYEDGREKKSMKLIDEIVISKKDHAPALNLKAYHMIQNGLDIVEAERLSLSAVSAEPENGHYLDTYGYILFKKGLFKEALAILKEAVRLTPDEPEIMEHLADVYVEVQKFKTAIKFYALASELYKGENRGRVGGKIAQIRSKRSVSSISDNNNAAATK